MKNPWEEIALADYESHMKLDSVMQLQALNAIMKDQFRQYPVETAMVLGVAGGNGLEHADPGKIRRLYGVDVNRGYLKACAARHAGLKGVLECVCADLTAEDCVLPHAELVIANLLIEYIGYDCFRRAVAQIRPDWVSCVIQINTGGGFVSDSPYLHAFDGLEQIHHQMGEAELTAVMERAGYRLIGAAAQPLPNGKKLARLDYGR